MHFNIAYHFVTTNLEKFRFRYWHWELTFFVI